MFEYEHANSIQYTKLENILSCKKAYRLSDWYPKMLRLKETSEWKRTK